MESGTKLGHYEILSLLGKGGMGEVYRARDTKLGREVAIKTLPPEFAQDSDRLARFEREAKLLASLNHPNIAAIYGLEEHEGSRFLVLELVEGNTLADQLKRGPVPVEESLNLALQIAEALEAAHEKGVIHRDLKPANIKVTDDSTVKVLDFGLAKAFAGEEAQANISQSPTLSMAATQQGIILGTAAYMSPEQAKGQEVDKRADIWAFGCVLYEMLTGRPTWTGATATDMIAAALATEPDLDILPAKIHPDLERVLRRCLQKAVKERFRDIGDVRIELSTLLRDPDGTASKLTEASSSHWQRTAAVGIGAMIMGGALGLIYQGRDNLLPTTGPIPSGLASEILLPNESHLAVGFQDYDIRLIALSPNGEWLVFVGWDNAGSILYRQELNQFAGPQPIPGTEGAIFAFFSPDGDTVGFLTADRVKSVALSGQRLRTLGIASNPVHAGWTEDGWIYFGDDEGQTLRRIPADGGDPQPEDVVLLPGPLSDVLPDGRFALTTRPRGLDTGYSEIVLVDLRSKTMETLPVSGYAPQWVPTGHLLFVRGNDILVTQFDPVQLTVGEDPVVVLTGVLSDSFFSHAQYTVSSAGTLAYVPGGDAAVGLITMVDRQSGETRVLPGPASKYGVLDLSPDDTALAVHRADVEDYIWLYSLEREQGRRLLESENGGWPVWNEDATEIAFAAQAESGRELMVQTLGSADPPRRMIDIGTTGAVDDWSSEDVLSVNDYPVRRAFVSLEDPESTVWIEEPGVVEWGTVFSPDGNWVAYNSDRTGRMEVWISSYPDPNLTEQISTDGAWEPVWCPCGELFFRDYSNTWFAARLTVDSGLRWENPVPAFFAEQFLDTPGRSYDISSDGQTLFVVQKAQPDTDDRIRVRGNWIEELRERVPVD